MPNPKHLIHAHSSVVTEGEPKLPAASRIEYGEIAVNFAEGHETLSIKNSNDDIVTFSSDEKLYDIIIENERTIATALNDMNDRISDNMDAVDDLETSIENQLDDKLDKMVSITYSSLKSKRDNSQLIPGQMYRITDYITTTTQTDTSTAALQFDIVVTATDVNILNETAKATLHQGVTTFNRNIHKWELKYCLDNDTDRFAWADTTNGKGVIYYMKDDFGNECPYDFKNILFKRYYINDIRDGIENQTNDDVQMFAYESNSNIVPFAYTAQQKIIGNSGSTNQTLINKNNVGTEAGFVWTFTAIRSQGNFVDGSQKPGIYIDNDENVNGFHHNVIKPCYEVNVLSPADIKVRQILNNNVFFGSVTIDEYQVSHYDGSYNNFLDLNSKNNTFYCAADNKIGRDCFDNICHYLFGKNTIGDSFQNNLCGTFFSNNTIQNFCSNNRFFGTRETSFGLYTIENFFENMRQAKFGNTCQENVMLGVYENNSFGNGCLSNYINSSSENVVSNVFGDSFKHNTFLITSFQTCTFGNNVEYCQIGGNGRGSCGTISNLIFENNISNIIIDALIYNIESLILKSNNSYVEIVNTRGEASGATRNVIIEENINNGSNNYLTVDIHDVDNAYTNLFINRTKQEVPV